jgi:hypothetical protein
MNAIGTNGNIITIGCVVQFGTIGKRRKYANTRRTDVSKQSGYFCLYFLFYYNFLLFYYLEKGSKETGH